MYDIIDKKGQLNTARKILFIESLSPAVNVNLSRKSKHNCLRFAVCAIILIGTEDNACPLASTDSNVPKLPI